MARTEIGRDERAIRWYPNRERIVSFGPRSPFCFGPVGPMSDQRRFHKAPSVQPIAVG